MSGLDQSLLIATTGYHVGHQRSIRAAEEQGYFKEEGFANYVYDYRGLIPGPFERDGLALQMKEHGVDIACGANVDSAILQRARGAEIYIVAAWRYVTRPKVVSGKGIARVEDLRGKRIGVRERGGLSDRFIAINLVRAGIDPERDVDWVLDPVFAYSNTPEHTEMLRSGKVDAMTTTAPFIPQLLGEGYHLLLDGAAAGRRRRPGRVIVATKQTIERRAAELTAFLRANLRAFWFCGDPEKFRQVYDLETRMRRDYTHNEDERALRIFREAPGFRESLMPLDGLVDADELGAVIEEMRDLGELTAPLTVNDVLRGELMAAAFEELSHRPELRSTIETIRDVVAAP
jgi:ABC-type nitrate/sulfonate/bicarbonate transport system substrate-binding protein